MIPSPIKLQVIKRFIRRTVSTFFKELIDPFWDRGQLLSLLQAVFATYLILQTASIQQVIDEIDAFYLAARAFGFVMLGWALICLIRAPLIVKREDNSVGKWSDISGNDGKLTAARWIYREPKFLTMLSLSNKDNGSLHEIELSDPEKDCFVKYRIEFDPAIVGMNVSLSPSPKLDIYHPVHRGQHFRQGGVRLSERKLYLKVDKIPDNTHAVLRIYLRNFDIDAAKPLKDIL